MARLSRACLLLLDSRNDAYHRRRIAEAARAHRRHLSRSNLALKRRRSRKFLGKQAASDRNVTVGSVGVPIDVGEVTAPSSIDLTVASRWSLPTAGSARILFALEAATTTVAAQERQDALELGDEGSTDTPSAAPDDPSVASHALVQWRLRMAHKLAGTVTGESGEEGVSSVNTGDSHEQARLQEAGATGDGERASVARCKIVICDILTRLSEMHMATRMAAVLAVFRKHYPAFSSVVVQVRTVAVSEIYSH